MDTPIKQLGNGKYVFEFFPQEFIDLNREIACEKHPKLQAILAQYPADEIDIKLAQTASYCEVMLDGDYTLDNRVALCKILKDKLVLMREELVPQNIILLN